MRRFVSRAFAAMYAETIVPAALIVAATSSRRPAFTADTCSLDRELYEDSQR
jgi:hypothetical protein